MNLQLADRTALVTGASQGLGRAIARCLADEGAKLVIAARRIDRLEELSSEIVASGGKQPVPMQTDFYPEGASEALAEKALKALGRIDILVNAAGGSRPLPIDAPKEAWHEGMTLNFWRIRELTHALLPGMVENRFGRIIHLTGTREPRNLNAAHAAKAAVHVWAKGMSKLVARDNVTVNSIQPGKLRSEQIDKRYPDEASRKEFADKEIPMGRIGEPEELGHLAAFLASPKASYITGNIIAVDGGARFFAF